MLAWLAYPASLARSSAGKSPAGVFNVCVLEGLCSREVTPRPCSERVLIHVCSHLCVRVYNHTHFKIPSVYSQALTWRSNVCKCSRHPTGRHIVARLRRVSKVGTRRRQFRGTKPCVVMLSGRLRSSTPPLPCFALDPSQQIFLCLCRCIF